MKLDISESIIRTKGILNDLAKSQERSDGAPFRRNSKISKSFIRQISQHPHVFHEFLRNVGLLPEQYCTSCQRDMTLRVSKCTRSLMWRCCFTKDGESCEYTRSLRDDTIFAASNLSVELCLLLTYEILAKTSAATIQKEYSVSMKIITQWNRVMFEAVLDYIESFSEPIGGVGKIVEIFQSRMHKRIYNRGALASEQLILGGIEHETNKIFLVPNRDGCSLAMPYYVQRWVKPGSSVYFHGIESSLCRNLLQIHNINVANVMLLSTPLLHEPYLRQFVEVKFNWFLITEHKSIFVKFIEIVAELNWRSLVKC